MAENEEASPWEPLHVERGIARHDSAVTVVGISGFINTLQAGVADLAEALTFVGSNDYRFGGCSVVALNPAQARALAAGGLDKAAIKRGIYERSKKRVGDFERALALGPLGLLILPMLDDPDAPVPIARQADDLIVIVAGAAGAGNHSLALPSFGNSRPVAPGALAMTRSASRSLRAARAPRATRDRRIHRRDAPRRAAVALG